MTDPCKFKDVPDEKLTLLQRLCKCGHHKLVGGSLWHKCTRSGCGYYWEYD